MKLLAKLQDDLKDAMRAGDVTARETLRMTIAALKNRRIEAGTDLDEGTELRSTVAVFHQWQQATC